MKQVWFILSLVAVLALTLASGVLGGRIRYRFGPSETMLEAAKRLQDVPAKFGGPNNDLWQSPDKETMNEGARAMLECTGYIQRTYTNTKTGDIVSMFVIVGPTGPIAVHTPEICFPSQNYSSRDDRKQVSIRAKDQENQFWALSFMSKNAQEGLIRVYYAWSTGDRWTAVGDPRTQYTFCWHPAPYLYKIQLSSTLQGKADLKSNDPNDPCREFLKDFVPAMKDYLVQAP